jgi:hypothetical protein
MEFQEKKFKCKRGVCQGDPLSPLLFVLAADLLQAVINKAASLNLIKAPIPQQDGLPVVQYTDDTLLILQADARQLFCLKALLNCFAESTDLKVNYNKSQMIPINIEQTKMQYLAGTFGCIIGSMPFTYLGLPMGTTKPRMEDFTPLMDRIERRLTACSSLLSYTARLEMINYVISPTVTYSLCTLKLPLGVIDNIDRACKQCLWRGNNNSRRGGNLVAWPHVTIPKVNGGLGIIYLRLQNDALLLKHLHKFYNKEDIPWVNLVWNKYYVNKVPQAAREVGSFWWKDELRFSSLYRSIVVCSLGDGSTVLFWDEDVVIVEAFPHLLQFARNDRISVKSVIEAQDLDTLFMLPLTQEAYTDLGNLQDFLQSVGFDDSVKDKWTLIWGSSSYSSSKLYKLAFQGLDAHPIFRWVWKSRCTNRIIFLPGSS